MVETDGRKQLVAGQATGLTPVPMARIGRLQLADLAGESFILLGKSACTSFHDAVLQTCRAAGFDPVIANEAGRLTSIIDMVASGLGIALVPCSLARIGGPGISFREIADNIPSVPLALATGPNAPSAVLANFVAAARQRSYLGPRLNRRGHSLLDASVAHLRVGQSFIAAGCVIGEEDGPRLGKACYRGPDQNSNLSERQDRLRFRVLMRV